MDVIRPETEPGRLRRFVSHPATLLAIGLLLFMPLYVMTMILAGQGGKVAPSLAPVGALAGVAIGLGAWKLYRVKLEGPPDRELAWSGAGGELLRGIAFGFVLFSAVTGGVALLGGFSIAGVRGIGNLWEMLAVAIFSGFYEEVIFRGVFMRHLESLAGTLAAIAVTSAFFGLAHMANPNSSLFAAFAIAVEAGILLGAAYLVTRRLWLAIGLHAGWNFTQGWVYSIPVSGTGEPEGLLVTVRDGPEWLTGGAFGLEASAVALVVATLTGLYLLRRAAAMGEVRPLGWRKARAVTTVEPAE